MFTKSKFCKLYTVTTENPSGMQRHSHDYMQIWYITKGCCEHWVEGQKHLMARGDIFIIPPKMEHSTLCMDDSEIICCEFSFDHFFPVKDNNMYHQILETTLNLSFAWLFLQDADDIQSRFSLCAETGKRVNALMHEMLVEYSDGAIYYEEVLRVQIMQLLLLLAREYSQSPVSSVTASVYDKYKPMVEDAIRYVDIHFAEPLKLEDVCRVSMVSKTYFCYLFKLLTQQTFVEYVMNKRIQKALLLLKNPDCSITWIGYEVGFNDSTHFSRTFKKVVGISPRTYRAIKNAEK
ncbi:MAG: AraC family transcriptional regulator [Oscillospiraceae bacterium]